MMKRYAGLVALLFAITACGGSSSNRNTEIYNYEFETVPGGLVADFDDTVDTLRLSTTGSGRLRGEFDTVTGELTVRAGTVILVEDLLGTVFDDYRINVIEKMRFPETTEPTAGTFTIVSLEGAFPGTVTVSVALSGPTVSIDDDNDGTPEVELILTWEEFEDLEFSADPAEAIAPFSLSLFLFLFEQVDLVLESFDILDPDFGFVSDLEQDGQIFADCDEFFGAAPGLANPGDTSFGWIDTSADGFLGDGDDFVWDFVDCFEAFTQTSVDGLLFNGVIDLTNFTEEIASDGLVTRLGYEGPDGVVFNDYSSSIAEDNDPVETFDPITLNGAFTIVFFLP